MNVYFLCYLEKILEDPNKTKEKIRDLSYGTHETVIKWLKYNSLKPLAKFVVDFCLTFVCLLTYI